MNDGHIFLSTRSILGIISYFEKNEQHWLNKYDQLERDFKEMEKHYQAMLGDRRVLLPEKTAKAVEWFQRHFKEHWRYHLLKRVMGWQIGFPVTTNIQEALSIFMRDEAYDFESFLNVLVNGYRTELTLEDKIKRAVSAICDPRVFPEDLPQRITDAVKAVLETS